MPINRTISLAAPILLSLSAPALAVTQDNFQLNTTADLVALCSAEATDPMMTAANNWCHGFMVGTYRILAIEEAKARYKTFCIAGAPPNRNQAVGEFVAWARAEPPRMASAPSDAVLGYLESKFPCKSARQGQ